MIRLTSVIEDKDNIIDKFKDIDHSKEINDLKNGIMKKNILRLRIIFKMKLLNLQSGTVGYIKNFHN
jgi:hypothetical protein